MDSMASDIVDLILQHLSAQDLCHVERVCHRLRSLGRDSAAWRTCFEAQYKDAGANPPAAEEPESLNWKQAYRAAYAEEKRRNNWKLKAKTFKLTSDLQVLERHIQHAFASIRGINTLLKQKEDELQALQSARSTGIALQCWQPAAVRTFLEGVVCQSTQLEDNWQECNLQQTIKGLRHDLKCLSSSLSARQQRLKDKEARLQSISIA
ncbi:hypothetical protein WJX84_007138 [Apatococcus fuscideae]|uniref:F-box domain-containing protein n=1 Tax=Apatococcus fuscideae TaxID=2026836 RepID=A0AAW1SLZ4_9CHLO